MSNFLISGGGGSPTGTASGDLSGTYPSPEVAKIQGNAVSSTPPTDGYALVWNTATSQYISSTTLDGIKVGLHGDCRRC